MGNESQHQSGSSRQWPKRKVVLAMIVMGLLAAGLSGLYYLFPQKMQGVSSGMSRLSGAFSFYLLGHPPKFYALVGEKNGKEFTLSSKDTFDVSYRDEFVMKDVASDSLLGTGITVDVEGIGQPNDLRVLLRGVELVDKVAMKSKDPGAAYRILVRYKEYVIAAIPVKIIITPQDWLRYAKNSDRAQDQIDYLKRAIAMNREDVNVRKVLAAIYTRAGMADEAATVYQEILRMQPDEPVALTELSKHYTKVKDFDRAIDTWKRVIKTYPNNPVAYANLAFAYGAKGKWKEEVAHYEKSLALDPKNAIAYYNLGVAFEKGKREQDAVKAYRKVLELKPNDPDAIERLAHLAFKGKRYDESIKLYEKIVKTSSQKASIHANLGFAYGELKDYKSSAAHYEEAIKNGIKDPRVRQNLALTYKKLGAAPASKSSPASKGKDRSAVQTDRPVNEKKYDSAIREYKKKIAKQPRNASHYASLGQVYGQKGDVDREIEYYKKALRYGKKDEEIYVRLGAAYERKGMIQDALSAYTKAYERNPDSSRAAKKIPEMKIKLLQQKHEQS